MWFAGVDWADQHHDIVVIDDAGRKVAQLHVEHSSEGLARLVSFLREITPLDQIACILEITQGLLITALLEAGVVIYPVNPKTVDRKRKASGAKTDLIDAYLLAKHGRSEFADLRRLEPDSPKIAELKALTRDQDRLIQGQTRLVNQITACLKAYYPAALHLFSKVQQRSTLVFLQTYPTPQAAQAASLPEIEATLKKAAILVPTRLLRGFLRPFIKSTCKPMPSRRAPNRDFCWPWWSSFCPWSNKLLSTTKPSATFFSAEWQTWFEVSLK